MHAFPSWQVLAVLAGLAGGLACTPVAAEAVAVQGLQQPWIGAVSGDSHRAEIDRLLSSGSKLVSADELRGQGPSGRASASLDTMFSSQGGSWPFEPFVNSGLFRQIANYQAQHPRALQLRGGSITLEQLVASVNNPQVLRSHKDGYLLSYPLLIEPGAELRLDGSRLYLYSRAGAAIINQGRLLLNNAHLESWSGEEAASDDQAYRPFVMSWAGSTTLIENSSLSRLGHNSHLSRGLTTGRSAQQGPAIAPARLLVNRSRFNDMANGVEIRQSVALIEESHFGMLQQYAVDILDSRARLRDNQIEGVRNNSGVRVAGQGHVALQGNVILDAARAGLEARSFDGVLVASGNTLGKAGGNNVQLRELGAESLVLLADNLIVNPGRTGIDADAFGQLLISGNNIGNSPEYGLYLRNAAPGEGRAVVVGNHFAGIGMSMIKSEGVGRLVLGNNQFKTRAGRQSVLAGDLLPAQSSVMDATVSRPCFVEVRIGAGATEQSPGGLDCGSGS